MILFGLCSLFWAALLPKTTTSNSQLSKPERSARSIILATLAASVVILGFLLIYRLYMAVFLLFTAFALQVAFQPMVIAVHQRGMNRAVGVFLVYALLLRSKIV